MELLVMMEPSVEECLEKFRATPDSCSPILILLRGVWIRAWIANSRCQRPSTLEDSTAMSIHRELQVAIIGDDGVAVAAGDLAQLFFPCAVGRRPCGDRSDSAASVIASYSPPSTADFQSVVVASFFSGRSVAPSCYCVRRSRRYSVFEVVRFNLIHVVPINLHHVLCSGSLNITMKW
ncbi:hypothetical protein V6N12_016628 [Hibiscus sabdariffa]|uniref:Uncharacterized protein n=1 Tax=Hibiscus sabdariffa TaxID=183260 RepID=A0ABR2CE47_9ROSI